MHYHSTQKCLLSGPSNWHDVGGKPESMWTPSSKKNDDEGYWFRLQASICVHFKVPDILMYLELVIKHICSRHLWMFCKNMGQSRTLLLYFYLFNTVGSKHSIYFFANDWIHTAYLWSWKRPLYQLSHNHCPHLWMFQWKVFLFTVWYRDCQIRRHIPSFAQPNHAFQRLQELPDLLTSFKRRKQKHSEKVEKRVYPKW